MKSDSKRKVALNLNSLKVNSNVDYEYIKNLIVYLKNKKNRKESA